MSENESIDEEISPVVAYGIKDQALTHLVSVANAGASFSITLVVEGQVISGDLISGKAYCERMYENFQSANGDKALAEAVGKYFKYLGEDAYTKENYQDIPLNYLHLDNFSYMRGDGGQININGAMLRVSIEKVSAFSLGRSK